MKPIFIFSLPRSGSTLLQRILASHDKISTTAEPWLLLSCFYALKEKGCLAEYNHSVLQQGVSDFCQNLPNGKEDYYVAVRHFAEELYGKASDKQATYFLDKTPRYSLVVEDVIETFPDGKFLFLWRNPLSLVASMMETWGSGRWNLYYLNVDLYQGLERLIEANVKYRDSENCFFCNYEDLITSPENWIDGVFNYLQLDSSAEVLGKLSNYEPKGRLRDPTGIHQYDSVNEAPLYKWKKVICNPFRKAWCRRYLRWIGKERLAIMGYDLDELLSDLGGVPTTWKFFFSDMILFPYGVLYNLLELPLLRKKLSDLTSCYRTVAHK